MNTKQGAKCPVGSFDTLRPQNTLLFPAPTKGPLCAQLKKPHRVQFFWKYFCGEFSGSDEVPGLLQVDTICQQNSIHAESQPIVQLRIQHKTQSYFLRVPFLAHSHIIIREVHDFLSHNMINRGHIIQCTPCALGTILS